MMPCSHETCTARTRSSAARETRVPPEKGGDIDVENSSCSAVHGKSRGKAKTRLASNQLSQKEQLCLLNGRVTSPPSPVCRQLSYTRRNASDSCPQANLLSLQVNGRDRDIYLYIICMYI